MKKIKFAINILAHVVLTQLTGGLWLVWLFVKTAKN